MLIKNLLKDEYTDEERKSDDDVPDYNSNKCYLLSFTARKVGLKMHMKVEHKVTC